MWGQHGPSRVLGHIKVQQRRQHSTQHARCTATLCRTIGRNKGARPPLAVAAQLVCAKYVHSSQPASFQWHLCALFLQEAPPDYGSERATGQACAALPRIVSAPCLLSVSQEGGSQNRLVASSLKREREAAEPFGSAEGHHKKRHVTGALLPSTSDDSGDSAETVQLEQSSAAPLAAAAAADGNVPALDISSRCGEHVV